jgi:hypothetical protein
VNAAILAPLLLTYAVPDAGKLDAPTMAADRCVSAVVSGTFDERPLTSNGWALDKESGKGALKDSSLFINRELKSLILVSKTTQGKPKCTVVVFDTEQQFDLIEYRLAAHFNGRLFPLKEDALSFEVPGHKAAVFASRIKVKDGPALEITVVPFDPEKK